MKLSHCCTWQLCLLLFKKWNKTNESKCHLAIASFTWISQFKVLLLALIKPLKISRSLSKLHIYNTIKSNAQMWMLVKIVHVLYHTALLQFYSKVVLYLHNNRVLTPRVKWAVDHLCGRTKWCKIDCTAFASISVSIWLTKWSTLRIQLDRHICKQFVYPESMIKKAA